MKPVSRRSEPAAVGQMSEWRVEGENLKVNVSVIKSPTASTGTDKVTYLNNGSTAARRRGRSPKPKQRPGVSWQVNDQDNCAGPGLAPCRLPFESASDRYP